MLMTNRRVSSLIKLRATGTLSIKTIQRRFVCRSNVSLHAIDLSVLRRFPARPATSPSWRLQIPLLLDPLRHFQRGRESALCPIGQSNRKGLIKSHDIPHLISIKLPLNGCCDKKSSSPGRTRTVGRLLVRQLPSPLGHGTVGSGSC